MFVYLCARSVPRCAQPILENRKQSAMNRNLFFVAFLLSATPVVVNAQVVFHEDFEDAFPGPGRPAFLWWLGGGVGGGTDPFNPEFPTEISTDGLGAFQQAWKITFDTTATANWYWFGGSGGVAYGSPEFPIGGVLDGGDNPGNWVLKADVRGVGMHTDIAMIANFEFWDPNYEATFGVDWNNDGDMGDGATTWRTSFQLLDNDGDPNGFSSNSLRLDQGSTPTTEVPGDIPRFGRTGTWVLGFFGGGGEYQFAANSVTVDNIMIEFNASPSVQGDYNGNGFVDAADYTVWRDNLGGDPSTLAAGTRDPMNMNPTINGDDYTFWKVAYGGGLGSGGLAGSVVPEPNAIAIALIAMLAMSGFRRPASVY